VKLYHPAILRRRGSDLQTKIAAMCGDPRLAALRELRTVSWPSFPVKDVDGRWVGYAMRKAEGLRLNLIAHPKSYLTHFPGLDRPAIVRLLISMLKTIQRLHEHDVLIGDFNPANFLCNPSTLEVTLIDCDSWQVSSGGKTFYCPVAAPDMLPKELHGLPLEKTPRTLEHEHFSVAILIFKLLMLGRHPFDVIGGEGPIDNIRRGYFPYGLNGGGIPKGPWFNIWSHLPHRIKGLFVRTFKDGTVSPNSRANTAEWLKELEIYLHEMTLKGWHDTAVSPSKPKSREYRGSNLRDNLQLQAV